MDEKINVNEADEETLAQVPGIGARLAARIVDYRETVHPFSELGELAAVPGISARMVRDVAGLLTTEPAATAEEETAGDEAGRRVANVLVVDVPDEAAAETSAPETAPEADRGESLPPDRHDVEEPAPAAVGDEEVPEVVVFKQLPPPLPEAGAAAAERAPAVAAPPPRTGVSRGALVGCSLLTMLPAIILGALLALAALSLLNGTLYFATGREGGRWQQELNRQAAAQENLRAEMTALSAQAETLRAANATAEAAVATAVAGQHETERAMAATVTALQAENDRLSTRVEGVAAAAEDFEAFLAGLRALLGEMPGAETAATATPAAEESPLPAPRATRTPRPSATPLLLPTPTLNPVP